MAENSETVNSATNMQPDLGAPLSPVEPAAPEVRQAELAPAWATKLHAEVTALQERVAQFQAKPPAWLEQAAELPERLAKRINMPAQLRQLEQRTQKARDTQTRALVASLTRVATTSSKGPAAQIAKQFKDLDRRLKAVEKTLGQIQRKLK